MSKKTYRVRGIDLDHDGERYPEGSEIELEEAAARKITRWLEPVAAVLPPKSAKAAKADDKQPIDGDASPAADDNGQSDDQSKGVKQ